MLAERLTYPEAIETVGRLLSRFPQGQPNNAKGYVGGLAQVLTQYPKQIAARCDDPVTGVPRDTEFLPTPARLIAWLERETVPFRDTIERDDRDVALRQRAWDLQREYEKNEADRKTRPTYDDLKAKYGPNWGINDGRPPPKTRQQCRDELIGQIGQEAFDALPDLPARSEAAGQ